MTARTARRRKRKTRMIKDEQMAAALKELLGLTLLLGYLQGVAVAMLGYAAVRILLNPTAGIFSDGAFLAALGAGLLLWVGSWAVIRRQGYRKTAILDGAGE